MKQTIRSNALLAGVCILCLCALLARAQHPQNTPTYLAFDVPGAGTAPYQGTFATAINTSGAIAGYFIDQAGVDHGFVRFSDGTIRTFDAPGAGAATIPTSINRAGEVTGYYRDANNGYHGFVLAATGAITTFDAAGVGTLGYGINDAGDVTGHYVDQSNASFGFVRHRSGTIDTFGAPGAGATFGLGTFAVSINRSAVAGYYIDANNLNHGFVRASDGSFATFEVPGAATGGLDGTWVSDLSPQGLVIGSFVPAANTLAVQGFVRASDGTVTTFQAKGAAETHPQSINTVGDVTGYWEGKGLFHGFVSRAGTITSFEVPGADSTGTYAYGINDMGLVTGDYIDAKRVAHGFLRTP